MTEHLRLYAESTSRFMNKIFSTQTTRDVYLYAPPYKRASAGITVLYMLCDLLNRHGQPAYMVPDYRYFGKIGYSNFGSNSSLICPVATRFELERAFAENRIPIIIYPETITGNPLNASNVVRYLLYYNSALTTDIDALAQIEGEGLLYYTNDIGRSLPDIAKKALFLRRLTMPVQDPSLYKPVEQSNRSTDYYYAEKFIHVHKGVVPESVRNSAIRITRDGAGSPTPSQLREILSSARMLHVFEDTAVSYEALLAGCVVNYHPDGIFNNNERSTTLDELGVCGTLSSDSPSNEEITLAKAGINAHLTNYRKWMDISYEDFIAFMESINCFNKPIDSNFYKKIIKYVAAYERHSRGLYRSRNDLNHLRRASKSGVRYVWRSFSRLVGPEKSKLLYDTLKKNAKKLPSPIYNMILKIYLKMI